MPAVTRRPKYQQIADELRRQILDGTYPVGSALPSTAQLMSSYGVSVTVIRAAVKALQTEGVAEGQPGKAVYVSREPSPAEPSAEYRQFTQQIEGLREALGQAIQDLDERLTQLEKSTGRSRSRRAER
ncbi:MAG: winged helix-turn-helix domain-containing protein [Pseudonocardia sp.]